MAQATLEMATELGKRLVAHGWRIGTAESCTGGLLAAAITDVPGSSGWFDEGLVTYANTSKQRLLAVPAELLESQGAVSRAVVEAMVAGVCARGANVAVATSGVAGPDGGTPDKPVGTVWIAWQTPRVLRARCYQFDGDRDSVRRQTVAEALQELLAIIGNGGQTTV